MQILMIKIDLRIIVRSKVVFLLVLLMVYSILVFFIFDGLLYSSSELLLFTDQICKHPPWKLGWTLNTITLDEFSIVLDYHQCGLGIRMLLINCDSFSLVSNH